MKIVVLVSYTYPYIGSGIGQVALLQAEGLAKLGHKVILVSSNIPVTKKKFKRNGVLHIKLNCLNFLDNFSIPVPLFFLSSEVISDIKGADIIHSHDMLYPYSLQAALLARKFSKPFVLTQHAGFILYPSPIINFLQTLTNKTMGRLVLKLSNKIMVVNEEVKSWLGINKEKVVTLVNGVDSSLFYPVNKKKKIEIRKKYHLPVNKSVVLFVGRLVQKKGFQRLFNARSDEYFIVFAGGGHIPESMNEEKGKALFLGSISQEELKEIYQASDVFVLPSDCEGFPLSIQEAMASGLPIITTKHPGFERYLDGRYVKFISPTKPAIKRAILEVLGDKNMKEVMIDYSLRTTTVKGSWEKNVTGLLEIYESTIK